jgi:hypothetical protein
MQYMTPYSGKTFYLYLLLLLVFGSCSENKKTVDDGYYFENFDNLKMWAPSGRVTSEQAHSGTYSTYTDSIFEYGETFSMDFSLAKAKGYKSMNVSAWCYKKTNDTKANFITSIESPDKMTLHVSADLSIALKTANTWGQVSSSVTLPDNAPPGSKIKVYLHAPNRQKVYLDDVEVQFHK